MKVKVLIRVILIFSIFQVFYYQPVKAEEVLPSWNEGSVKEKIITFVETVTDPENPGYIPPEDRIATFDNDGTLWVEKPIYIQIAYEVYRIKKIVEENPDLKEIEPYKSLYDSNTEYLAGLDDETIVWLFNSHKGTSEKDYEKEAGDFLEKETHPDFKRPYKELTYLPMVELIAYLQENNFKVYMVTAGETGFVRSISEEVYNIPVENVIGSFALYEFKESEGKTEIVRGEIAAFNAGEGKPANIELFIGKKPVFAFGNSDGDFEMYQYTADNEYPSICLSLHHDDLDREVSYDEGAEEVLKFAEEKGWIIVSMKRDFKRIFLFDN